MSLSRRVQILVDDGQYARLEREAERRGGSVGSVVRDALDRMLPPVDSVGLTEAGDVLLEADPIEVGDWQHLKEELLDAAEPDPRVST